MKKPAIIAGYFLSAWRERFVQTWSSAGMATVLKPPST